MVRLHFGRCSQMIRVSSTAVRAWVQPDKLPMKPTRIDIPFRSRKFEVRVLAWDTETTTGFPMRLLYGTFGVYVEGELYRAGVFYSEDLPDIDRQTVEAFALENRLDVMTRLDFVEKIFYPEVYVLGTLCVGFNLPFDIAQIAIDSTTGKGQGRRRVTFTLTRRIRWPRVRIEPISGKAAFIGFAPKKYPAYWEKPFFKGRFLDLSTLTTALTGERHSLRSAVCAFTLPSSSQEQTT